MKYLLAIAVVLLVSGTAAALSVSNTPVNQPHLVGVGVAHPTGTLQVEQAGPLSYSSPESANLLQ